MSRMIVWEAQYLGSCFLLGIFLILFYDLLRLLRIVLPHGALLTAVGDLLYWLGASAAIFLMLYKGDDGVIRWYAVAAIALAMLLFNFCVSRHVVPFVGGLLRAPIDFVIRLLKRLEKRVKIEGRKFRKRWFHGRKKEEKEKEQ